MATTRVTPHALPGYPWGSFAGKEATEAPAAQITRLTPHALPGQLWGSFAGKEASDEPVGIGAVYRPLFRPRRRR